MTFHSFEKRGLATRRLRYAIVASLLGHLLVLWPSNLSLLTKDTPALLHATLRLLPQLSTDAAHRSPQHALRPAPALAPPLASPVHSNTSPIFEQANRSLVAQAPAVPVESVPQPALGAAASVAAAPAGATLGASSSPMMDASASGEAADGLRGYRLAVATQARRYKRYPAQAMASGWTGSADIRVEVGSDGRPRAATVIRSSGYELLDVAALTMIDAAAVRARLPESLRGKAFAVVLPVVFNLDDD